mmetsp:Transcript_71289/g.153788  ORF Transcript_71289/g.153788 Transcript_71289/m.153788 type:complete len:421 (+) Transcript_71289:698-1960(+)
MWLSCIPTRSASPQSFRNEATISWNSWRSVRRAQSSKVKLEKRASPLAVLQMSSTDMGSTSSFFSSSFFSSFTAVRDLQKAMDCSIRVISATCGWSSSFSAARCLRTMSYSLFFASRSSTNFFWRSARSTSWYLRYSRSFLRYSSRASLRSLILPWICLPMASRWSMISGRSPSWALRCSMSSDIFSWICLLPSRSAEISALISGICSLRGWAGLAAMAPSSASFLFTCDTLGRLRFSCEISCRYFFSSLSETLSVHILNSMEAMRSSISDSDLKPSSFFILPSACFASCVSALFAPICALMPFLFSMRVSILPANSSSCPRRAAFWAKNSSLPPERAWILTVIAACFFWKPSMASWILFMVSSKAARSGGGTLSASGSAPSSFGFFSALGLALGLGASAFALAAGGPEGAMVSGRGGGG